MVGGGLRWGEGVGVGPGGLGGGELRIKYENGAGMREVGWRAAGGRVFLFSFFLTQRLGMGWWGGGGGCKG